MKVIAFMNQKGGVGKTTTTFHFAAFQKKRGKSVLCIDLDPQGSLSFCMNAKTQGQNTVYELLSGDATFEETVQTTMYGDILPADNTLAIYSNTLETVSNRYRLLQNAIGKKIVNYDYVLIDCPPGIALLNINAFGIADDVVIVTQAEALSILGLPQAFNLIENSKKIFGKEIKIAGILITMYNGVLKVSREMKETLSTIVAKYDIFSYNTLIKKLTAINESTMNKMAVFDYAPSSQASVLYSQACEEIENSL